MKPLSNTQWYSTTIVCLTCDRALLISHNRDALLCSTKTCPEYMKVKAR